MRTAPSPPPACRLVSLPALLAPAARTTRPPLAAAALAAAAFASPSHRAAPQPRPPNGPRPPLPLPPQEKLLKAQEKESKKADKEAKSAGPKKNVSSYFHFQGARRAALKEAHPELGVAELAKLMGEEWKARDAA